MSDKYFAVDPKWQYYAGNDADLYYHHLHGTAQEIEAINPAGVLIFTGSEMDIETIFQPLIGLLVPWLKSTNKKIHLFSSGVPYDYHVETKSYIVWHECHAYDITNFHTILRHYQEQKPIISAPTTLFTCYNNRPCDYRTYLIDQLARANLLDDGVVTYRYFINNCNIEEEFLYYDGTPRLVDEEDFVLHQGYIPNDLPKSYLTGLIDIVTESRVDPGEFYLSEKTCKPILAQKPFLALSSQHYHAWLKKEKGIELYDEIFDYTFDTFPRFSQRALGIVDNLIRLREEYNTPKDYKHLLQKLAPKLNHNLHTYIKYVLSGKGLSPKDFEWINLPLEELQHYLVRGEDYFGELYNINHFYQRVILPYNRGEFSLPFFPAVA